MGEVVGKCFVCEGAIAAEARRVVEVRVGEGPWTREDSCWRCWMMLVHLGVSGVLVKGERREARAASLLVGKDFELVEKGGE